MAKRRKKYKPVIKPVCRYCLFFYEAVQRTGKRADPEGHRRFCRAADDWVEYEGDTCDDFDPSELFWCNKNNYWLKFSVCAHRRENLDKYNSYIKCKRCTQSKVIDIILSEEEVVVPRTIRKLKKLKRRR